VRERIAARRLASPSEISRSTICAPALAVEVNAMRATAAGTSARVTRFVVDLNTRPIQ
jgi:hypothetical protein